MMKRLVFLAPMLFAANPAKAEVCDKVVGEWWRPDHGPVHLTFPGLPGPWIGTEAWKLSIAAFVILLLLIAKVGARRWIALSILSIASLHSFFVYVSHRTLHEDGIIAGAIREGCISPLSGAVPPPSVFIALAWSIAAIILPHLLRSREPASAFSPA